MTLCVGLTGGIASGKSYVAGQFRKYGTPVLDADEVARLVVAPGSPGLRSIVETFGTEVLAIDGGLDRLAMRRRVFQDLAVRRRLEAIIHPLIRTRLREWQAGLDSHYAIYSAAILIESGTDALMDRVLVVDVPESVQLTRLLARDQHDEALARSIISTQTDRAARLARADDVLDNTAGDERILPQIQRLHTLYVQLPSNPDCH